MSFSSIAVTYRETVALATFLQCEYLLFLKVSFLHLNQTIYPLTTVFDPFLEIRVVTGIDSDLHQRVTK